jgi:hypothetical protein
MHASAATGVVGEERSASLEGFVETVAMPRRNRSHISRSDSFGLRRADHEDVGAVCSGDGSNRMALPLLCFVTCCASFSLSTISTGRGRDNARLPFLGKAPCHLVTELQHRTAKKFSFFLSNQDVVLYAG